MLLVCFHAQLWKLPSSNSLLCASLSLRFSIDGPFENVLSEGVIDINFTVIIWIRLATVHHVRLFLWLLHLPTNSIAWLLNFISYPLLLIFISIVSSIRLVLFLLLKEIFNLTESLTSLVFGAEKGRERLCKKWLLHLAILNTNVVYNIIVFEVIDM